MMMTMMILTIVITTASYCLIKHPLGSGAAGAASGLLTHFFFSSPNESPELAAGVRPVISARLSDPLLSLLVPHHGIWEDDW